MFFGPSVYVLRVSLRDVKPEVWRSACGAIGDIATEVRADPRTRDGLGGIPPPHVRRRRGAVRRPRRRRRLCHQRTLSYRAPRTPRVGSALKWDYDFGDSWQHDVVVEAIDEPKETTRYPICVDGACACPPEDCGGTTGYKDLVKILANPRHREHDSMVEWAPDGFDPAAFDLTAANRRLRAR